MAQRLLFPLIAVIILAYFSVYRVEQWQQALVFRFREVERVETQPGLHLMWPFVNTVKKFETRLLNLDQAPQRFLTVEKKDVIVDYYVKWRISDVKTFYTSTGGGDIQTANLLLGQQVNSALRDEFGKRTIQEVVAGERGEVLDIVTKATSQLEKQLGIKVVDVRTKRINLPEEVSSRVYARMRAERMRAAKKFRARGAEAAERIKANADRERQVILANAYRDAETTRGEGDAQATEIYAEAYSKNEEFYKFYRSLNAYKSSFNGGNNILLLAPNSEFFKYFNDSRGK